MIQTIASVPRVWDLIVKIVMNIAPNEGCWAIKKFIDNSTIVYFPLF